MTKSNEETKAETLASKDCLGCKIVGTCGLVAASGYVCYHGFQSKTKSAKMILLAASASRFSGNLTLHLETWQALVC